MVNDVMDSPSQAGGAGCIQACGEGNAPGVAGLTARTGITGGRSQSPPLQGESWEGMGLLSTWGMRKSPSQPIPTPVLPLKESEKNEALQAAGMSRRRGYDADRPWGER